MDKQEVYGNLIGLLGSTEREREREREREFVCRNEFLHDLWCNPLLFRSPHLLQSPVNVVMPYCFVQFCPSNMNPRNRNCFLPSPRFSKAEYNNYSVSLLSLRGGRNCSGIQKHDPFILFKRQGSSEGRPRVQQHWYVVLFVLIVSCSYFVSLQDCSVKGNVNSMWRTAWRDIFCHKGEEHALSTWLFLGIERSSTDADVHKIMQRAVP